MRSIGLRELSLLALLFLLAGAEGQRWAPPSSDIDLQKIAATDPRIEYIARQLCIARGLDPDHIGPPYPGSVWWTFIIQARDFLAADDAAEAWIDRRPGRKGPPD